MFGFLRKIQSFPKFHSFAKEMQKYMFFLQEKPFAKEIKYRFCQKDVFLQKKMQKVFFAKKYSFCKKNIFLRKRLLPKNLRNCKIWADLEKMGHGGEIWGRVGEKGGKGGNAKVVVYR